MEYEDSPKFLDYPKRARPQAVNKIFGKLMDDYSSEEDDKTVNWEWLTIEMVQSVLLKYLEFSLY